MKYHLEFAVLIASMSGFMLGYDAGVVSELFTSPRFMQTFNITEDNWEMIKGNMVAILQAGCAVGALISNIPAGKHTFLL
ncbi:hypothetical protein K450DRAFT_267169 [Umbelopsis ramanniana AG]|uniref:Major facilitator superfamily (MFS) profile domain-containing protein n=1 Tax=Umbelopsis ramanniana AG TaxID=1314678 RepID=A0AAD5HJN2_UMBRA|nr:uncharacterized protein K450DRAFT_267169 [Umbelopsis ramanniana AG]KAI8584493.1 hypothetical protein K450DRAFT_267169 [Umbelopsis ramanniana AG]